MAEIIKLMDSERGDIILALEYAQSHIDRTGPECAAQWERWELLIQRLKHGATAD